MKLCGEQLEPRLCCAAPQAIVTSTVRANLSGQPGAECPTITPGGKFFVELKVEDVRDQPQGLRSLGVRLSWQPDDFDAVAWHVTDAYPLWREGRLDQQAGVLDWLQGLAMLSMGQGRVIGDDGPEEFALIEFLAERAVDAAQIKVEQRGDAGLVPWQHQTVDDVLFQPAIVTVTEPLDARRCDDQRYLAADLSYNGIVDGDDVRLLDEALTAIGHGDQYNASLYSLRRDVNCNGLLDLGDFGLMNVQFGRMS